MFKPEHRITLMDEEPVDNGGVIRCLFIPNKITQDY